jgi:hypothetical protein
MYRYWDSTIIDIYIYACTGTGTGDEYEYMMDGWMDGWMYLK